MRSDVLTVRRASLSLVTLLWAAPSALAAVSWQTTDSLRPFARIGSETDIAIILFLLAIGAVALWIIRKIFPDFLKKKDNGQFIPETPEDFAYLDKVHADRRAKELQQYIERMTSKEPTAPPTTTTYGSAKWAQPVTQPESAVTFRGVFFGKSSSPDLDTETPTAPIYSKPESHTLIVARTRAGKGTRVIVPTLLRYDHSMLVIDPKGENAAITARRRRDDLRQTVHIVNPWGVLQARYTELGFSTATFNPLDAIDRDDHNAVALAQSMAATICPVTPGKEAYWQGSAANVLAGVFLWLAYRKDQEKTLGRARQLVTQSRDEFKKTLALMVSTDAFEGAIKEMVSQYLDLAPETYSGIMSNLAESTKFISDPQIKKSTAASSFSMKTLRDDPTTVFLVIPHDRIATHSTWLRLVISSTMYAIKNRDQTKEAKYRCMFLIDEFGSLGHIPDVPRDIAIMSGYGLDFTFIIQGLDQLKNHYGEAKGTILNNCSWKWFCNVADLETAKYLSDTLGKKTVSTVTKGQTKGESARKQATTETEGESTTFGETGRALLTPDEILNLGRDTAILLNPLGAPHYLQPIDYWKLSQIFRYLQFSYPSLYWNPGIAYDENPYIKKQ